MNLDDKSLFLGAMEDVQPLKHNHDVHWHPARNTRAAQRIDPLQLDNFLTTGYLDIVPLATALEFKREGLQSGVLEKLRRGKYGQHLGDDIFLSVYAQTPLQYNTDLYQQDKTLQEAPSSSEFRKYQVVPNMK